jgi:hypothetical protein
MFTPLWNASIYRIGARLRRPPTIRISSSASVKTARTPHSRFPAGTPMGASGSMSIWECPCKSSRLNGAPGGGANRRAPIKRRFSATSDQRFIAGSSGVDATRPQTPNKTGHRHKYRNQGRGDDRARHRSHGVAHGWIIFPGLILSGDPGDREIASPSGECNQCGITLSLPKVFRPFAASAVSYKGVHRISREWIPKPCLFHFSPGPGCSFRR